MNERPACAEVPSCGRVRSTAGLSARLGAVMLGVAVLVGCDRPPHAPEPPSSTPAIEAEPTPRAASASSAASTPLAGDVSDEAEPACTDANEDDDQIDINQVARWMGRGEPRPQSLVACPGNVDFVQGEGDFTMTTEVRWDPALGDLDIRLVNTDGSPYHFDSAEDGVAQGQERSPGRVRFVGGAYQQHVRIENRGSRPVPYRIEIHGAWGE